MYRDQRISEAGNYDVQQVCLNGHQITDSYKKYPDDRQDYCEICGDQTIFECPNCKAAIRGHHYLPHVFVAASADVPSHCSQCGKPYPWTERRHAAETNPPRSNGVENVAVLRQLLARFHLVVRQLGKRHSSRAAMDIKDEYDVQDLLHALLRAFFDDIRPEEWTPSYAAKSCRMDFLLKNEGIVIEVKMTRLGLGEKEVGTQLIEDIHRYSKHPDCKRLICFVYDPESRISNPKGLETDLSDESADIQVEVLVVPSGH